jgi:AcrR family transcriptional regulator
MASKRLAKTIEFAAEKKNLLSNSQWIKRQPTTELGHRIVRATVDEFADKGVQGSRVAEITRRAGTTDPNFYRYFLGLRQAALFIMSEYYWSRLNKRINHYQEATTEPERLFDLILTSLIKSVEDDPERPWLAESKVFQIVVAESRNPFLLPEAALDEDYVRFLARLEEVIRSGQQRKVFRAPFRPALVASLLVNTLHGLLAQRTVGHRGFRADEDEVRRLAYHIAGRTYTR